MGKILTLPRQADRADWYGALLDDDGREIPITEAMVQRALEELAAGDPGVPPED